MKPPARKLLTPIYLNSDPDLPWPEDKAFNLLAGNGLFICRNHEFFESCVPARGWPGELADQRTFLKLRYPKLPRRQFELAVGFCAAVYAAEEAEAAILLIWDRAAKRYRLVVPEQRSTVYRSWSGRISPIGVHYEIPANLPAEWAVVGDIHGHCDHDARPSWTDKDDESYRSGLHIIVGRMKDEPPQFHFEAVVDGKRFSVDPGLILEAPYRRRRMKVPAGWLQRVTIEQSKSYTSGHSGKDYYGGRQGGYYDDGWSRPAGTGAGYKAGGHAGPSGPATTTSRDKEKDDGAQAQGG